MASRFLRKSTRRQIRDFDNFQNAYPNLKRSSDQTNLTFNNQSPFDDTRTIRFGTDGAIFPSMTPAGYNNLPSSSISLSNMTKIRASSQEYLPDLPGNSQSLPFDETRVNMPGTEDYIATSSVYRLGFKSAIRNKIAIPIDISTSETKTLFKLSQYDTALDPAGPLYGSGSTGFVYYNFQEKRWEDIGLTDQYRGHLGKSESVSLGTATENSDITGSSYYMQQFLSPVNTIFLYTKGFILVTGQTGIYDQYYQIGSPTNIYDAPNASRYHATSSQLFSLSNFINQPFILEEIEVTIPISATRKLGSLGGSVARDTGRDTECINFFMYRQSKGNNPNETNRKLISYETIVLYNDSVGSNGIFGPQLRDDDFTSRGFNQVFNYKLPPAIPNSSSTIEKTLNFKFKPKNAVKQGGLLGFNGRQNVYTLSGSSNTTIETQFPYASWDGNDSYSFLSDENPMYSDEFVGPGPFTTRNVFRNLKSNTASPVNDTTKFLRADPRYIYKTSVPKDVVFIPPGESPYILFPDDELIFGIDDIVPPAHKYNNFINSFFGYQMDSSFLSVTASLHKILRGPAKITLHGSLIQNGQEKLFNNLNQNLISPAIHELVFDPTEDSDQFLISERYTYSGSYLDNYMSSGSVLNGTRFVSASLTTEYTPVGGRGSFERFVGLSSPEEVYYDCLMVDSRTTSDEDEAFNFTPTTDTFAPITGSSGNNLFQTDGNLRPSFPYRSGKVRVLDTPTLNISSVKYTGKDFKTAFFYTGKNEYSNFPYDIRSFFSSSLPGSNYISYGMLNVENQQPKNIFRPDRYGQMRDMLEQPFDTITYKLVGVAGPTTSPVTINFVSASSEIVVSPELTNSNNLNKYSTSSLPYFDGINRSRATAFPSSSLGPFTPTTIVFQT